MSYHLFNSINSLRKISFGGFERKVFDLKIAIFFGDGYYVSIRPVLPLLIEHK